uniref:Uncharacterized protein n=1 Tax=Oryza glumipatula TaxID=40148 RepID=A0A0D9ZHZ5_9ORYZ
MSNGLNQRAAPGMVVGVRTGHCIGHQRLSGGDEITGNEDSQLNDECQASSGRRTQLKILVEGTACRNSLKQALMNFEP